MPALTVPLIIFSALAWWGINLTQPVIWVASSEDVLVVVAWVSVAIEIARSTEATPRTARRLIVDLLLLLLCLGEWCVPWARSGTFLLLTTASFVNLVAPTYVAFVVKGQNNVWITNR